jgi:hypothetical protein
MSYALGVVVIEFSKEEVVLKYVYIIIVVSLWNSECILWNTEIKLLNKI